MTADGLPEIVHDFILRHIHSVYNLEALILIYKDRSREWSLDELCEELRCNQSRCKKQIEWLSSKGFISTAQKPNHFKYLSNSEDESIAALAKAYSESRLALLNLISDRLVGVKEFADAFRIRKDKKDG